METSDTMKLAVLEERTKHLSATTDEMKTDLKELSSDVKKIVTAIEKVDDAETKLNQVIETSIKHATIGKVLIFLVTLCSGLIGWSYNNLEQLKQNDNELRERIVKLEILYNAINPKR